MGLAHSPKIITDNLVLCLDAANTKSYGGSGATWTDLSGKGNNVTLNGATYNSSNSGVFDFDGTYVREYTILDTFTSTSDPWSVECWFNTDVNSIPIDCMIAINYNNGEENTLLLGVVDNSGCKLNVYYRNNQISSNTTVTVGQWHHVVATHTSGSLKVYLDGTQIASDSNTVNRSLSDCAFLIGAKLNASNLLVNYFNGKISNVKMYNKTLTATEVKQNFNALRGRYGI
jgi:hypothetical protein